MNQLISESESESESESVNQLIS